MSLLLTAVEGGLAQRIRSRIAEGAAICEAPIDEVPSWLETEAGEAGVTAYFHSEFVHVAILADGRTLVRRARA